MDKKVYHHTAIGEDGKVYEYFCYKFPDGSYNLLSMERREITDPHYCEWYKKQKGIQI